MRVTIAMLRSSMVSQYIIAQDIARFVVLVVLENFRRYPFYHIHRQHMDLVLTCYCRDNTMSNRNLRTQYVQLRISGRC